MILYAPESVAFTIFGLEIYWYGIIMACAILSGIAIAQAVSEKYNLPANFWIDNSPWGIIAGIIGARLYYCLANFNYYFSNISEVINIRQGGLSIHGAIIGGLIFVFILSRHKKIDFFKLTDCLACALPFAQSLGRWGNFFNNEAFGMPTNGLWGLYIPIECRPELFKSYNLFHPAFLYESFADLIIFGIIMFTHNKTKKSGISTCIYLILYSAIRILIESIRTDSILSIQGIALAQIVSLTIILTTIPVLVNRIRAN